MMRVCCFLFFGVFHASTGSNLQNLLTFRLSPIYMFVLMAFACLYKYLGSGPMWPSSITTAENCKDYWWTNLLYVNNLVHLDNQVYILHLTSMCTWSAIMGGLLIVLL